MRKSLLFFGGSRGARAISDNFKYDVAVLGAVVVDLFAKMGDEAAWGHENRFIRFEFGARANPPGPRNHGDEPIIGVKVGTAHMVRGPFDQDDILPGLRKISPNYRSARAARVVDPRNLIGQLVNERGRVEVGGFHRAQ